MDTKDYDINDTPCVRDGYLSILNCRYCDRGYDCEYYAEYCGYLYDGYDCD